MNSRVNSAVLNLNKIALITKVGDHVNVHRLLQFAFRYSQYGLVDKSKLQAALDATSALLDFRFPNHEGNKHLYDVWSVCSTYLSSVLSLRAAFESVGKKKKHALSSSPALDRLLKNCCWYLYEAGQHHECVELLDFASRISLDKESLTYATLCQAYACTYYELNDLPKCRMWNEACLKIRQKLLKPDDPDVANVHSNLGNLLTAEGHFDDAISELFMASEPLHEDVADDQVYIALRLMVTGRAQFAKGSTNPDPATAEKNFDTAEKTYKRADDMFVRCGSSGAFLHSL
jgi:tetratricopeptide (TPR) repeat protein